MTLDVTFNSRIDFMSTITLSDILRLKGTVLQFKEILIASGEPHAANLRRRLNYYVQRGELIALRRGLYAKDHQYDRLELATKIYTPSYISFETVLAQAGIIFQYYKQIFVATYQNKTIECDDQEYTYKKLKEPLLTTLEGLEDRGSYFIATKERAFLDTLYLNKEYFFDNLAPLDPTKIEKLLPLYNNKQLITRVLAHLKGLHHDS